MKPRKAIRLAWHAARIGLLLLILLPLLPLYLLVEAIRRNYRHIVRSDGSSPDGDDSDKTSAHGGD